ncbi:MAG: hypothetical protein LBE79_13395 [Tannerella sp.]|jgi:hypothetical protein|nr:hypothetical protein [Tannerella sp.]
MENVIDCKLREISKNALIAGIALAIVLFLLSVFSTWFFLTQLKVTVLEWSVFNACAPTNFAYVLCFLIFLFCKKEVFLPVTIVPLFFFGTMGLFIFPWNGMNLFAQASHIVMTLNVVWIIYITAAITLTMCSAFYK